MKFSTALDYFGSPRQLAEAAGVTLQAVSQWKQLGRIPSKTALRLQTRENGKLKVDAAIYEAIPPKRAKGA